MFFLTNQNVILRLKLGGYEDDVSSLPEVDQEEENSIDSDEFYDLIDKEVKEYCKSIKKVSYKKTIENGSKWMSEDCFLGFTNSAESEKLHFEVCQHCSFLFIFTTQSKVMFVIVCLCICRASSTSLVSFTVNVSALSLMTRIFITITSLLRKSMEILMFGLQNFILLK
jgi:hypothetical protein